VTARSTCLAAGGAGVFRRLLLPLCGSLCLTGCRAFEPEPLQGAAFLDRAVSATGEGTRVTVAALTAAESRRYLGVDLAAKGIQPVWIRIENESDDAVWFLPAGTDPEYFAPYEVAYRYHRMLGSERNARLDEHFLRSAFPNPVPPRGSRAGFVFTHQSEGAKFVAVEVAAAGKVRHLRVVAPVPGGRWDFQKVDFDRLYPPASVKAVDLAALKAALEALPCCTESADGKRRGDPLNLVIVGEKATTIFPFVERGWNLTEPFDLDAARKSAMAFLFRSEYATSPVSPLYLFGRPQDLALQKARSTISQRNHLRVWLAPLTFRGAPVWVGQISRDIGVRFTTKSWYLTTHKVDPDMDEDRFYLLQDLAASGYLRAFARVGGVGAAPPSAPRFNLTGDPYFTDGERMVLFLGDEHRSTDRVESVDW